MSTSELPRGGGTLHPVTLPHEGGRGTETGEHFARTIFMFLHVKRCIESISHYCKLDVNVKKLRNFNGTIL